MLLWLTQLLQPHFLWLRVFQYLTFRSILVTITTLVIVLLIGPKMIRKLSYYQVGQVVRNDGPQTHLSKSGTPTMGGALMLMAITIGIFLWGNLSNIYTWVLLAALLGFGAIGWMDDYIKLRLKNSQGLKARWKYLWQSILGIAIAAVLYIHATSPAETNLLIPYIKDKSIYLGAGYLLVSYFVIVGSSNAVNLTDGLDGLAIMPTVMVAGALAVFAYLSGNIEFSKYLAIPYIPGAGEAAVFGAAIIGAGLGFLWFNTYPAQVFMGDVGALGLGAALGTLAIISRQEIVLFIVGGIFVVETLSVILQVASFKLTGKRLFRMAPLHHHFELKGWPEPRVIVRFWIITFILVLIGLASLKIR